MAEAGRNLFPTEPRDLATVVAHYYRGELSRMISWRNRIDLTTNWALGAVAGMLSLSLAESASHGVMLFAMLVVFLILFIEARRYRFFHIYRTRVRRLERHYYATIFTGVHLAESEDWLDQLGDDLRAPRFTLSLGQALSRRLRRNYVWMFLILLLAWLLKATGVLIGDPAPPAGLFAHAGLGAIPGWTVAACVGVFYAVLAVLLLLHRERPGELAFGDAHL